MINYLINNIYSILAIIFAIIGLLIAYYGLIYNRPRIELDFISDYYDLKENLMYTKILFRNTGTLSAFNIKIKNLNKNMNAFIYPENYEKYKEIEEFFNKIDELNIDVDFEKIKELNYIIHNIDSETEFRKPNFFIDMDDKIYKNNKIIKNIEERNQSINSFFNTKINILLPNKDKIAHLTDHDIKTPYGTLNIEEINLEISYDQIENISKLSFIFRYLLKKIKLDFFMKYKLDIKTRSKIKTITEIKYIRLNENIKKEDFFIKQKINKEKFREYKINEFNKFLNSFRFINWFNSLNKFEKDEMIIILNKNNNEINEYLKFIYYIMKEDNKISSIFIQKYMIFLNLLKDLPYADDKYENELRHKQYEVDNYVNKFNKKNKFLIMKK